MKKVVKKIFLIFLALLFIEIIFYLFKSNHDITYKIKGDKNEYAIHEIFKNNKYYLEVTIDHDTKISFNYDNKFHKASKILTKVEYYKDDANDLVCIYPVLKRGNYLNVICSKDNELYYYDYVKDKINFFIEKLIAKGYSSSSWIDNDISSKLGSSKIYQNNIPNNTYIYVWKYNGFYTLNYKKIEQLNVFQKDTYLNKLGTQVNQYYIIPNYDEDYDYSSLYIFNMVNNTIRTLKFKKNISQDYYINGVVNNKLYFFDKEKLLQYKVNPRYRSYEIIGNKDAGGLYYDGKWSTLNIYDFKKAELKFNTEEIIPDELKKYELVYRYKNDYYYFEDNNFMIYNDVFKTKTFLFNIGKINNQKFINNDLYFIKGNILYYYNVYNGLHKIMEYEELSFNKVNRYAIYKK